MSRRGSYPAEGVVSYDPDWPRRYAEVAGTLAMALDGWETEHIGSTSVPGLAAKPVIDIAVRIPPGESVVEHSAMLVRAGWTAPESLGSHLCSFLLEDDVRRAIGHFFTTGEWDTAHQRLFAAWLRRHPADRDAYGDLKRRLRADGTWGRAYTEAKTDFVQKVVDRARAERGLAPIPVWDKA